MECSSLCRCYSLKNYGKCKNALCWYRQEHWVGAYIQPGNYFVSYIFCTNAKLKTARQIGLTEKNKLIYREQLKNIIIHFKRQVKAVSLKVGWCFFVAWMFFDCLSSIDCMSSWWHSAILFIPFSASYVRGYAPCQFCGAGGQDYAHRYGSGF